MSLEPRFPMKRNIDPTSKIPNKASGEEWTMDFFNFTFTQIVNSMISGTISTISIHVLFCITFNSILFCFDAFRCYVTKVGENAAGTQQLSFATSPSYEVTESRFCDS